jgi:hypothetical protein
LSGMFRQTKTIMEKPKFYCETCDFSANKLCRWEEHKLTKKHSNKSQQIFPPVEFYCKSCDVRCSHLSVFNRHKKTKKHLKTPEAANISAQDILLKENQELRNFIIEQSRITTDLVNKALDRNSTTITNNNIKNDNKSFNINVFLNEQCKDAINFSDFVKNIEISHEDLENTAQLGFVSGISKILMDNLKQLGVNERPIHCTDTKRETMYIKEENKWTKEPDDSKLQKAIQTVSCKSMKTLQDWKKENPEYQDADSAFSMRCLDMQKHAIAGSDREVYYPKVIHVLARETMVNKEP